jgi:hypothetical protein
VPDFFVSNNCYEQPCAKPFTQAFEAHGFKAWWSVGPDTSEAHDEVAQTALRTAKGADTFSALQFRTVDLISNIASSFRR